MKTAGHMLKNTIQVTIIFCSTTIFAASHHPQDFLKEVQGTKQEGQKIVQHFCANCHAEKPLIPIGAPIAGDYDAWKPRVAQGLKVLMSHTEEGMNAMPPMGGCFECSDEQLQKAVFALLPEKAIQDLSSKKDKKDHK